MMGNKILYFEAPDGISGDMVLGALIDMGADLEAIREELDKFVKGEYALIPHEYERHGLNGTNLEVFVAEEPDTDEEEHGLGDLVHEFNYDHTVYEEELEEGLGDLVHEFNYSSPSGDDLSLGDHVHEYDFFSGGSHHKSYVHRYYRDIRGMILSSGISKVAKTYALAIFDEIASAEAAVHNVKTENVQFHEIGAMDSIIDIVGTAIAIELWGNVEIYCSAVHDGSGTIVSRHGIIPVPVPAVMEMAKGTDIPIVIEHDIRTEMVTPTGFGILKGLQAKFEPRLGIIPDKIGYGFGKRNTGRIGAVRVTLGEKSEVPEEK